MYERFDIVRNQKSTFLAWVCPLLKPMNFHHDEYIFFEGDPIDYIYVLSDGAIALALPKFENKCYLHYRIGNTFGVVDILGSCLKHDFSLDDWFINKN